MGDLSVFMVGVKVNITCCAPCLVPLYSVLANDGLLSCVALTLLLHHFPLSQWWQESPSPVTCPCCAFCLVPLHQAAGHTQQEEDSTTLLDCTVLYCCIWLLNTVQLSQCSTEWRLQCQNKQTQPASSLHWPSLAGQLGAGEADVEEAVEDTLEATFEETVETTVCATVDPRGYWRL